MAKAASSRRSAKPLAAKWQKPLAAKWQKLLALIPSYDPCRDAAGCWFDPAEAQRALDFFPECLRHVEGAKAGQPFELEPWQQCILANLVGWKRLDEQGRTVRRYREALIYVPRKNGKTPFVAGIALYILFCDDEVGQQDYIAAGDREQAGMLFRQAKGMVEQEPELAARCRVYGGAAGGGQSRSIVREELNSFLRVISADADTKHGGNTHAAAIDELHVQPNRDLVDVLKTSMASANRKQPLLLYITTADFARPSICNEVHDYACKVRDGIIENARFLPVIYEAPRDADWTTEAVWRQSNPNLGVSVSLEYLRAECAKAKETPAYENTFRRLHLNQKTETDVRAIPMDKWDAAGDPDPAGWRRAKLLELAGRECYGGLDLGSTSDLTALGLLFPEDGGAYTLLPFFWVPLESARRRERRDRVPYEAWVRQGFAAGTDGDVTDYDRVRRDVNELAQTYGLRELAVDRLFQGAQLCTQLAGDGLDVIAFGQGFFSMAAPTKKFLELVIGGKLAHGGNPVLRWMAANVSTETDPAGNLKPSKKKSSEKIDGIVAAVMALGRAMLREECAGGGVEFFDAA